MPIHEYICFNCGRVQDKHYTHPDNVLDEIICRCGSMMEKQFPTGMQFRMGEITSYSQWTAKDRYYPPNDIPEDKLISKKELKAMKEPGYNIKDWQKGGKNYGK